MPATSSPLLDRLNAIVGRGGVLASPSELVVYECDGYTIEKNKPDIVVFPTTTEHVVQIVKACNEAGVPFLPRGAGTSLSGGFELAIALDPDGLGSPGEKVGRCDVADGAVQADDVVVLDQAPTRARAEVRLKLPFGSKHQAFSAMAMS